MSFTEQAAEQMNPHDWSGQETTITEVPWLVLATAFEHDEITAVGPPPKGLLMDTAQAQPQPQRYPSEFLNTPAPIFGEAITTADRLNWTTWVAVAAGALMFAAILWR